MDIREEEYEIRSTNVIEIYTVDIKEPNTGLEVAEMTTVLTAEMTSTLYRQASPPSRQ